MKKEEILKRIENKEKEIEKIEKRITKWSSGLRPQDIAVCKPFGDCVYGSAPRSMSWRDYHGTPEYQDASKAYNDYINTHKDIPSSDDWNKGPNISELKNAYRDLGEARNTLEKYKVELQKLDNYENAEKIEVIWDFLMQWKDLANEWYHKNCEYYFNLKKNAKEALKQYKDAHDGSSRYFEREYYEDVAPLTRNIIKIKSKYIYPDKNNPWVYEYVPESYTIDEGALEYALDKEIRTKYENLVNEITHITGPITDASGLSIGGKGDINGIVVGENGKARVNTFSAEGPIQRFHYRTRVTRVE